jgi:hypothetical protein
VWLVRLLFASDKPTRWRWRWRWLLRRLPSGDRPSRTRLPARIAHPAGSWSRLGRWQPGDVPPGAWPTDATRGACMPRRGALSVDEPEPLVTVDPARGAAAARTGVGPCAATSAGLARVAVAVKTRGELQQIHAVEPIVHALDRKTHAVGVLSYAPQHRGRTGQEPGKVR